MLNYLLLFNKRLDFDLCFNSIQNSHVHGPSKLVENLQHLYITTEKNLTSTHRLSLGFRIEIRCLNVPLTYSIECLHMTSRRPYWCPKTMKQRPCWCPKPVTGKNNGFPFLDIFGYLKNTHKNRKFGKVRQIPTREFPTKFPDWDLSHSSKFGIFVVIL